MEYDNEQLKELCMSVNLLEYAQQNFEFVKKTENSWVTICPFHHEKTPSCSIDPVGNYFYCFGCGAKGSIIDWICRTEKLSFDEAVSKVASLAGTDIKSLKIPESIKLFKEVKKKSESKEEVEFLHRPQLDINDYNRRFVKEYPQEWLEDGISKSSLDKFEIRVDPFGNRIVYPIYDIYLDIVGVKGRTRAKAFKEMGIAKYMNYFSIGKHDFFLGWKQNIEKIKKTGKVIIFEGIKSVMLLNDYGYDIGLAAETSKLSKEQQVLLITLGVKEVTIAFDSDVKWSKIMDSVEYLRYGTNVSVIKNRYVNGNWLLGEKESPVDNGKDTWNILYNERVRIN